MLKLTQGDVMANNIGNLVYDKGFDSRTTEEQTEIARKGGIASGEARRQKKLMREMLQECLNMTDKKGNTFQELATMGLIKGAIKGNANNYKTILETLGELQPAEQKENGVLADLVEALTNVKKS